MATRKKLPNLKICVDNTQSSEDSDAEVDGSDSSSYEEDDPIIVSKERIRKRLEDGEVQEDEGDVLSIGAEEPTERRFLSRSSLHTVRPAYGPRIYENKTGNFVTGVDVTSEEATEKREKRAQRFGILSTPKQPITDLDIKNLYKSLGMDSDTLDQDIRGWRTDAILLRGTDNMSTKDVFDYFTEYAPKGIEWVDDSSCNVLWQDKLTPARALLKLSSSMEEVGASVNPTDGNKENQEASSINKDKEHQENIPEANKDGTNISSNLNVPGVTSDAREPQPMPVRNNPLHDEPVLNVMEEENMELDYDDNLDLMGEDPIDQALSTWANFSQNKKLRAENAERQHSEKQEKEKEKLPEKGKLSNDIVIKEEKDVNEKEFSSNKKSKESSRKEKKVLEMDVGNRSFGSRTIHEKNRLTKTDKSKYLLKDAAGNKSTLSKRREKMDTSSESDSESSSSGSSSSGSVSSSSSSSSGSDSESGSGSTSSSSSSSSAGHEKKKLKKTHKRRDKETRKLTKRPAAPPIIPQAKEKVDIPWPPGWWRLGVPYPKAKYLFMRYAMKADKKIPGAEKRSQYYVKYGNPNFGGAVGLISNSRKRRMRNIDREKQEDEHLDTGGDVLENPRLAGRLGIRDQVGNRKRKMVEDDSSGHEDTRLKLKEGVDLRDVLNWEVAGIRPETGDHTEPRDSDDEMDYGAELERLMGGDAPPTKKRFMRMHADDEEEKMIAKRLLSTQRESRKWPKQNLDYEDDFEEELPVEEEEEEEEEYTPKRKEWVDYDNVDDDDPFNLFGTSKQDRGLSKKSVDNDDDEDDEVDYKHTSRKDERRGRDVKQRLGGSDLRAKIQGLKRVSNRNW